MQCKCGFENAPGARFCGKCGAALEDGAGEGVPSAVAASLPTRSGVRRPSFRVTIIVVAVLVVAAAAGYWWLHRPPDRHKQDTAGPYRIIGVDGKSGFVDRSGRVVINPQFEEAGGFSDGMAIVRVGGKYGYIDTAGAVAINPQFDAAGEFRDGLAPVALNDRWGYVDRRGAYVVNAQFDRAYEFSDGLAAVIAAGRTGYVGPKGQIVINPQFDFATIFSQGLAAVRVGQRWGYVDTTGTITINPQFDDPGVFSENLAAVSLQGRFGYIGTDGTYVITPQFESALEFSEGAAAVKAGEKWGYIARDGKYIVSPQFDAAWPFADGRGLVRLGDNHGYIDAAGKFVINPQYAEASSFVNGLAAVREESGRAGFIDRTGKYVWTTSGVIEKTMADMRAVASAWEAYATDAGSYQIDGILDGDVSTDQVSSALTPTYINRLPQNDGWGKPLLLRVLNGGRSYSILSAGPNQTSSPKGGAPDGDDLVYSGGSLIQAPVSGRPAMSGYTFLRELVLSELVGEWRDDRDNCLSMERHGAGTGDSWVSASFRRCDRGSDGQTLAAIGLRLIGRSLYWVDNRQQLALLWDRTLEGTLEGMPSRDRFGTSGSLRFRKVRQAR